MKAIRRAGAAGLLAAMLLSGCGGEPAATPSSGGTLLLLTSSTQAMHLDPQRVSSRENLGFASAFLHRTLTAYSTAADEPVTLQPDLATDLGTMSPDARTWTFTLRDGLKFENGAPITCASVKFGVARSFAAKSMQSGTVYAQQLLDIPRKKDGFTSVYKGPYIDKKNDVAAFDQAVSCSADDRTITFKLNQPFADFNHVVSLTSFAPVPKGTAAADEYDRQPISSGPYRVDWSEPGQRIGLVRNPNWSPEVDSLRRGIPAKIELRFGSDVAATIADLRSGSPLVANAVLLDPVPADELSTVFNDPALEGRRLSAFDSNTTFAVVNVKRVPCLEIRQAIGAALDRQSWLTALGGSEFGGDVADGLLKPGLMPVEADQSPTARATGDPARAVALLAAAKTKCKAKYKKFAKDGLTLNLADSPTSRAVADVWVSSMAAAGIKLRPAFLPVDRYYSSLRNPKQSGDISIVGWSPDWLSPSAVLPALIGDGKFTFNLTRNSADPIWDEFVAQLNQVRSLTDAEGRSRLWRELDRTAVERGWIVPGIFTKRQLIWGANVAGAGGVTLWTPFGTPNYSLLGLATE